MAFCKELALDGATDLSQDRLGNRKKVPAIKQFSGKTQLKRGFVFGFKLVAS
jgi:hypothetical protein